MITYISPINMVAEDNHLYFAYKSPLGECLAKEREESDGIFPDRSVQRHSVTSLDTARLLANGPS